jgi:uncharacterized protein
VSNLRISMVRAFFLALLVTALAACASTPAPVAAPCPPSETPPAGKFEMKNYFMGFLRRGPNWTAEQTPEVKQIGEGHMAHIRAMGATGKLILAGPFEVEGTPPNALAGILLFDVETIEQARLMASEDPAVKAGRLTLELIPWYGPKGITFPGREVPPLK